MVGDDSLRNKDEWHAAGQEAPINPAEIDRKLVGEQEAVAYRWMRNGEPVSEWRNGKPSEREVECARELIGHADWQPQFAYLAPAQPPASAEVGRDWRRHFTAEIVLDPPFPYGVAVITNSDGEQSVHTYGDDPVLWHFIAAMAASSGRKGGD